MKIWNVQYKRFFCTLPAANNQMGTPFTKFEPVFVTENEIHFEEESGEDK